LPDGFGVEANANTRRSHASAYEYGNLMERPRGGCAATARQSLKLAVSVGGLGGENLSDEGESGQERWYDMFMYWRCKAKVYRGKTLHIRGYDVANRQAGIPGFSQAVLASKTVACAGSGDIISEIGSGLVRKGVGALHVCDPAEVEPSDLSLGKFHPRDLWKNKALSLARNLAAESSLGTEVTGIPTTFIEAAKEYGFGQADCYVCGIGDELAREEIVVHAMNAWIPLVTAAVSPDGDSGYVHVHKPGGACWGCVFPRMRRLRDDLANHRAPCTGSPAFKDILMLVGGAALYAVDAVVMARPISWNYREFHMGGFVPDVATFVERRPGCKLCSPRGRLGRRWRG
jgi:molybdopterin/thiamine biosynthesis adenylyltransferase